MPTQNITEQKKFAIHGLKRAGESFVKKTYAESYSADIILKVLLILFFNCQLPP